MRLYKLKARDPDEATAIVHTYRIAVLGYDLSRAALIVFLACAALLLATDLPPGPTTGVGTDNPAHHTVHQGSPSLRLFALYLEQSGDPGDFQTLTFTTYGQWAVTYGFECPALDMQRSFQLRVYHADGTPDTGSAAASGVPDRSSYVFSDPGPHYLSITSKCSWHVAVIGAM